MKKEKGKTKQLGNLPTTEILEQIYREYLVPMTLEQWSGVKSLEQPLFFKEVPLKTTYSTAE